MFASTYIRRELRRRRGRTVLTVLGLALGVGLVAAITSISSGLDDARENVLNPLASVGTDLVVTRPATTQQNAQPTASQTQRPDTLGGPAGPGGAFIGPGAMSPDDAAALANENSSVITDLSKLSKPGEKFEHTYFLPATQLTFPVEQGSTVANLDGVTKVAYGLTLLAVHQKGTVPQIVAEIQTGGEEVQVEQQITPPTEAERRQIEQCMQQRQGQGQQGGQGFAFDCLPERLRRFRGTFRSPQRTIRQALNPPQTDIASKNFTIAGVDPAIPDMGLITRGQVTSGSWFSGAKVKEAILSNGYASRENYKIGGTVAFNGETFKIIGFAEPPLGGQAADVYVPLVELQRISKREGRVNVLLVRAEDAGSVARVAGDIEKAFEGSDVASAKEVADQISGSLVDASNLADRMGIVLSVALLAAAFLIASLLSLSSVAKRVRELGTLKAIGWRTGRVVRQVLGESLAQGALGGLAGLGLGAAAAIAFASLAPPLKATAATSGPSGAIFGLGTVNAGTSSTIALSAPIDARIVILAFGLALLGGLIAGAAGALRAARLRPADALREIG